MNHIRSATPAADCISRKSYSCALSCGMEIRSHFTDSSDIVILIILLWFIVQTLLHK